MITLAKFKSSFEHYKEMVEKITSDELTFLWFDDYYDGMLSGIVKYKLEKLRFEIITDYIKRPRHRIFALIDLTEEQLAEETYWHNLFKEHVGTHTDLLDTTNVLKPEAEHSLFYKSYENREKLNYDENLVKGWFIESK